MQSVSVLRSSSSSEGSVSRAAAAAGSTGGHAVLDDADMEAALEGGQLPPREASVSRGGHRLNDDNRPSSPSGARADVGADGHAQLREPISLDGDQRNSEYQLPP